MKYVFVVNCKAGGKLKTDDLENEILALSQKIDYEIYETKCHKDATEFVKKYCEENENEEICFVACGGDGTINEVASGLVNSKNKHLAILAYGSGNDLIRYYKNKNFVSVEKLINGTSSPVDIIKIGEDRYSINVCNVGLESIVCAKANEIKDKGGKNAYTKGIIYALLFGRKNLIDIEADGEKLTNGKILLCTFSNHGYAGGGYNVAPYSNPSDGLIEVCAIQPMPLPTLLRLLPKYKIGKHMEVPKITKGRILYRQVKNVHVYSKNPFELCLDGEMLKGTDFNISILEKAINFITPAD